MLILYSCLVSPENSHSATISNHEDLLFNPTDEVSIEWSPQLLMPPATEYSLANESVNTVDIGIYTLNIRFDTREYELSERPIQIMTKIMTDNK